MTAVMEELTPSERDAIEHERLVTVETVRQLFDALIQRRHGREALRNSIVATQMAVLQTCLGAAVIVPQDPQYKALFDEQAERTRKALFVDA